MSRAQIQLAVVLKNLPATAGLGRGERATLDLAKRLAAELGGVLTAVAPGPAGRATPHLEAALAAGCDRAVCVVSGRDEDYPALSRALGQPSIMSRALKALSCDLVLCSDRAENDRSGAFGPALAEALGMAHLTAVVAARASGGPPGAIFAEQRGDGMVHAFSCTLPILLCVLTDSGHDVVLPPHPDHAAADPDRIEHLAVTDLVPATPGSWTLPVPALPEEAPRTPVVMADSADELVAQLARDGVLPW